MYLEGVLHQLEVFAMAAGVRKEDVVVRLTFFDGDSVTVRSIHATSPFGASDWGMIRGNGGKSEDAIVVREEDIRKIEFQLSRLAPFIGFQSVSGST